MKITAVETVRCDAYPNLIWVRIETDDGLTGLGESYFGTATAEEHIHGFAAPRLVGQDPRPVARHAEAMRGYLGFAGTGAEMRGNSAIDIALWDLLGKVAGLPLHTLLGGAVRDRVRVYNTCAGPDYVKTTQEVRPDNFGLPASASKTRYDDLDAFLNRADELAHELLEMGIGGMKIWPFDFAAEANRGLWISSAELARAIEPFEKIRDAVGDRIEIKAELHGLWHLAPALRIADALEEFDLSWIEDPVRMDHPGTLAEFTDACVSPVAAGETLGGVAAFRELMERHAVDIPIIDLSWGGGLTVARKVADLADAWRRPVAAHDCSGPVVLAASVHLAMAALNVAEQEMVRAFYYGWYGDLVTALPPVEDGHIRAPDGPGLGLELDPAFLGRPDIRRRRTVAD